MRMCPLAWLASLAMAGLQPQVAPASGFALHLPHTIDTTRLDIRYFLHAAGAGVGGFVRPQQGVWDYMIPMTTEYGAVTSFKTAVFVPGYSIALIDVSSVAAVPARELTVDLAPLPLVTITGRIVAPTKPLSRQFVVDISYEAGWQCVFFGLIDCMTEVRPIAQSKPFDATDEFSLQVADLARDPALARFRSRGEVCFNLHESPAEIRNYGLLVAARTDGPRSKPCFSAASLSSTPFFLFASPR